MLSIVRFSKVPLMKELSTKYERTKVTRRVYERMISREAIAPDRPVGMLIANYSGYL